MSIRYNVPIVSEEVVTSKILPSNTDIVIDGDVTFERSADIPELTSTAAILTGSFTGSFSGYLTGTSSWALSSSFTFTSSQAFSSSLAVSSSWAISASQALTASYIDSTFISASAAASGFGSGGGSADTTAVEAQFWFLI